ncbi:MAG TPA: Wzt carbohydrate-binding domain-containing protein, partial [Chitinophagaceae bacterium]|nr:Wzt carbohydrate-binding domain-containing protein [Chitinophagaceae bacterium]
FAVAAHLESEILIVDEVLAVGDYEFQKKCLGKMGEVSKGEGKTVLFVSHNLGSIQALCNQGILLDNGIVAFEGTVSAAIREYSSSYATNQKSVYTGTGIIREVRIINNIPVVRHNSDFHIEVKFHSKMPIKNLVVEVVIKDELDVAIVGVNNWHYMESRLHDKDLYDGVMNVIFKPLTILPGKYKLDIYVGDSMIDLETVSDALSFEVEDTKINSTDYPLDLRINKIFIPEVNWQLNHS